MFRKHALHAKKLIVRTEQGDVRSADNIGVDSQHHSVNLNDLALIILVRRYGVRLVIGVKDECRNLGGWELGFRTGPFALIGLGNERANDDKNQNDAADNDRPDPTRSFSWRTRRRWQAASPVLGPHPQRGLFDNFHMG